jgi:hypothetical protein
MAELRLKLGSHDLISYTVENGIPTVTLAIGDSVVRIQPSVPIDADVVAVAGHLAEAVEAFHIDVIKENQYLPSSYLSAAPPRRLGPDSGGEGDLNSAGERRIV